MITTGYRSAALVFAAALFTALPAFAQLPPPAPSPPYTLPAGTPAFVRAAIEAPSRPAEQKSRDGNRKPAELLMLSGVKPGDKVLEFAAFGHYFTDLISNIIGPNGKVTLLDLPYTERFGGTASRAFVAAHPNAQYQVADYNTVELPQNLDVVFNVLYYHDLPLNKIDTAVLNAKIFKALKPGGVFLVVDHNAEAGSGIRDIEKLHRIDPAVIRKEVTAAGFQLAEESKVLAHATDDHTWGAMSAGKRGLTDQSVFKFVKPAR